jgi:hypothetical protein
MSSIIYLQLHIEVVLRIAMITEFIPKVLYMESVFCGDTVQCLSLGSSNLKLIIVFNFKATYKIFVQYKTKTMFLSVMLLLNMYIFLIHVCRYKVPKKVL